MNILLVLSSNRVIQAIIFITSRKLPDYTNLIKIDLFITANDNFAVLNKNNYKSYLNVLHLGNEIYIDSVFIACKLYLLQITIKRLGFIPLK